MRLGVDEETTLVCQTRYGRRFDDLLDMIEKLPKLAQRFVPEAPVCLGELVYCSRFEMVANLQDLLRRRLPLSLTVKLSEERLRSAASIAGKILNWSKEQETAEIRSILAKAAGP